MQNKNLNILPNGEIINFPNNRAHLIDLEPLSTLVLIIFYIHERY